MRVLSANSAVRLVRTQAITTTTTTTTSSRRNGDPTTSSLTNNPPTASSSSNAVIDTTPVSNPTASSTTSTAIARTSISQPTKIGNLRPRVLPRLTGEHRKCCFYGYRWCCYIDSCVSQ